MVVVVFGTAVVVPAGGTVGAEGAAFDGVLLSATTAVLVDVTILPVFIKLNVYVLSAGLLTY